MGNIEHAEGWKPRAKALYDEAIADRDRWRREYEAEKAKVRRIEHDLRGAVEALTTLANPTHTARTEEAALVQIEVVGIAQAALDHRGGQ